ncbi:KH domain-containing protein akap-1 [Chelonus insularis]|uniref:KH domain-containing protein akap-1 n=1 Tax=Chelonus insularis TaxID=460826 RepID=UPI0015884C44|nr:KH domain-containing protein akap-1 [Chelonus insularis]XP_034940782.1 KH domain-containing protein akap-1 [Chelonus insularis]
MSIHNIQLIKWTFPAFAFIIGFLWYKRRGVERVDPGGRSIEADKKSKNISEKNIDNNQPKNGLTLYDSGIHIDKTFTTLNTNINTLGRVSEEVVCSPRKVSDSLDIPIKKSSPQSISMRSRKSSGEKHTWYEDIEDMPEMNEEILGSNPKLSSFDLMTRSRPPILENIQDNENNIEKHCEEELIKKMTPNEQSIPTIQTRSRSVSIETCEKPIEEVSTDENKTRGQAISERDSANHSPVSGVLDGSVNDDIRSEGSTDSGKGGSINGQVSKNKCTTVYEFELPLYLVGKFIGRHGTCIQELNAKADVNILLQRHPTAGKHMKLCVIEGLPENINIALELIRQQFPEKKHPSLTLEQVNMTPNPEQVPWMTELMHLQLIEGVNNDVMVCHIIQPNRLFIQLPTHPTYPSLRVLDYNMTQMYSTVESPPVPDQLSQGMLVVAKWYDKWVRAYVEEPDPAGQQNLVRLVDHGGFWTFSNAEMRKIRSDYLTLPFQAIEVSLANIKPVGGEWVPEAYDIVAQLCTGSIGQAQIEGYIDTVVYISLYINMPKHGGVISVAHELIARGYAEPVSLEELAAEQALLQV